MYINYLHFLLKHRFEFSGGWDLAFLKVPRMLIVLFLGPHFECISPGDAFFPTVVDKCRSLSSPRAGPGSCSFWALWPLAQHSARHTVRAQSTSADSRWFSGGLAKWQKPWAKKLSQKNLLYDSFFPECGLSTFHKLAPRILPPTHRGRHYHHCHPTDEEIASVRWRTMPKVTVHAQLLHFSEAGSSWFFLLYHPLEHSLRIP